MSVWPDPRPARMSRIRVGVATHSGKFFIPVRRHLQDDGVLFRDDAWSSHRFHHAPLSHDVANWADVLIAEWCLGNAVWHAARRRSARRPGRLLVRLHRFEIETEFPGQLDIEAVDAVIFVSPHMRQEAMDRYRWPADKCLVIPNAIDVDVFDGAKTADARFTLGLLTWYRRLKRLDLALDILEGLRRTDERYRLRIKGPRPEHIDHVWKRDDERRYFAEQYARIEEDPHLRGAVIFDPAGRDVPEWFRGVGHILSLSDVESFHLALAEGLASAAVPVIRDRAGAAGLFGMEWIVQDTDGAIRAIGERQDAEKWRRLGVQAREEIRTAYDRSVVLPAWQHLVRSAAAGGMQP